MDYIMKNLPSLFKVIVPMDYSCKKLINVLVLNFKGMFSARVKLIKKDFCIVLAGKQQECRYRAPLTYARLFCDQSSLLIPKD